MGALAIVIEKALYTVRHLPHYQLLSFLCRFFPLSFQSLLDHLERLFSLDFVSSVEVRLDFGRGLFSLVGFSGRLLFMGFVVLGNFAIFVLDQNFDTEVLKSSLLFLLQDFTLLFGCWHRLAFRFSLQLLEGYAFSFGSCPQILILVEAFDYVGGLRVVRFQHVQVCRQFVRLFVFLVACFVHRLLLEGFKFDFLRTRSDTFWREKDLPVRCGFELAELAGKFVP